jgi:hypothetical protein
MFITPRFDVAVNSDANHDEFEAQYVNFETRTVEPQLEWMIIGIRKTVQQIINLKDWFVS